METTLKDYLEENDDEDFYFKWEVKNVDYGQVEHHIIINDKVENEYVEEVHIQKTLEVDHYLALLKEVGFNNVNIYSDFDEYHQDCQRVIFVCKKG